MKKRLNHSITFILILTGCQLISGQGERRSLINDLVAGIDIHYGSVLAHHESIGYSVRNHLNSLGVSVATNTYGRSGWDKLYRYPGMGAGYLFTSIGNKEIYGNAHSLYAFLDFPFKARQKKFYSGYQINFGIAYIDKKYDVNQNPLNMAISTHLNIYGSFRVNAGYSIDSKNEIRAGLELSHFSNGKLASPNLGINSGALTIGYRYKIMNSRFPFLPDTMSDASKKHRFELVLSAGAKSDDQLNDRTYLISSMIFDYKYIINNKYAIGAGQDLFFDQSLGPNKVASEGGNYSGKDLVQTGFHAALYARYSNLTVYGNAGTYIYATYIKYIRIYTRIGLRYDINRNFFFNLSLKAHYANADFIEWGIGTRF